jgi:hypothetical protein
MSVVYPRISGSIGGTPNYLGAVVSIGQPDGTWHVYFSDDDLPKEIKATIEKVYLDEDG